MSSSDSAANSRVEVARSVVRSRAGVAVSALDAARWWRAVWWAALAAAPTWERRYRLLGCVRHYEAATDRVHAAARAMTEAAE